MPHLAKELAYKVWELCWHFIGPHQVKMDQTGTQLVVRCADVVESLATYNCLMEKNPRVLRATLGTAENLFDVAMWYKNEKIAVAVLKIYREALNACRHMEGVEFRLGVGILQKSANVLARNLKNSALKWPTVLRTLRAFTSDAKLRASSNTR